MYIDFCLDASVLITGGAGFIGSKLAASLRDKGFRNIFIIDNLVEQVHGGIRPTVLDEFEHAVADVADFAAVSKIISYVKPDIIFHMASETGTGQSMDLPVRYCTANITGTATLLELIKRLPPSKHHRHIVLPSSRSIYGEGAYRLVTGEILTAPPRSLESMALGNFNIDHIEGSPAHPVPTPEWIVPMPASVYASTKLMQESLVAQLAPLANMTYSILRFQNVYGPGQSLKNPYTGVISIMLDQLRLGKEVEVYEDGEIFRDFIYVDDVVDAMISTLGVRSYNLPINIGSGSPTSIWNMANVLTRILNIDDNMLRVCGKYRAGDIRYAVADIKRAQEVLKWNPKINLEQGLRRVVEWSLECAPSVGGKDD